MPNPTINFRLSPYQIARGLWIVRKLEPNYKPSSASKLIKMLYLDYLAKMSYGRSDVIPALLLEEVKTLVYNPKTEKSLQLDDIISRQTLKDAFSSEQKPANNTESIISTVTNFSLPAEWLDNPEEEDV